MGGKAFKRRLVHSVAVMGSTYVLHLACKALFGHLLILNQGFGGCRLAPLVFFNRFCANIGNVCVQHRGHSDLGFFFQFQFMVLAINVIDGCSPSHNIHCQLQLYCISHLCNPTMHFTSCILQTR